MTAAERFLSKVEPEPMSGCWLWVAACRHGYGVAWHDGRVLGAHRLSFLLFHGDIPEGMFICHKCDIRCCVNPDHLFAGTQGDNMRDARRKGRMKGLLKPRLTDEEVAEIKKLVAESHDTHKSIADRFGVSRPYVSMLGRGLRDDPRRVNHRNAKKTHCAQGHPYKGDNLVITKKGWRRCRECIRESNRRSRRNRRKE